MLKKVITWAVVIFALYYIVSQPANAAALAHHAGHGFQSAASSLSRFVSSL